VLIVSVAGPDPFTAVVSKLPLALGGKPLTFRFTVPENPFWDVTVVVYIVLAPICTVWLAGLTATPKSGLEFSAGRISTSAKLYLSVVGDVSLMVTVVPLSGVTLFCRCTHNVLLIGVRYWWTIA